MHAAVRSYAVHLHTFNPQKGDLRRKSTAEAAQLAVRRNHAVTRNDDGNRVGAHRLADGSGQFGPFHLPRQIAVRHDVSVRHGHELSVDGVLELGDALEVEGQVEDLTFAGHILSELLHRSGEASRPGLRGIRMAVFWQDAELYPADPDLGDPQGDGAYRGLR